MLQLDHNKKYLLGCSFGPDSMALFDMLYQEKYNFEVAIVNYNIREESPLESQSLKQYCAEYDIVCHVLEIKDHKWFSNIEAECRKIRYQYFKDLTDTYHFDEVLIAHNEDDLIETYILQIQRKSLVEYYGIKEVNEMFGMTVRRPLLKFSKSNLLDYCRENYVPFIVDKSNYSFKYKRNIIRHKYVSHMSRRKRRVFENEISKKNAELKKIMNKLSSTNLHSVDELMKLSEKELAYAVTYLVRPFINNFAPSLRFIANFKKTLISYKPNIIIKISENYYLIKSYKNVEISDLSPVEYSYELKEPGELDTPYFYLDFRVDSKDRNVSIDDYPITICSLKGDEQYEIKGYKVKVSRLFIDWKLPLLLRNKWPCIKNKDGEIIYIPRYQNKFDKSGKCLNFYVK